MAVRRSGRLVYATEDGRVCPGCGWPATACRCAERRGAAPEPVPARVVARLRLERKGRGGKTVTVVEALPRNPAFVAALVRDLKRACGTGGRAAEGAIELQGDQRARLRTLLVERGFDVRG